MSILIADSGGTKTTWLYQNQQYESIGLNPNGMNDIDIENHIKNEIQNQFKDVKKIYFYGAGCATQNNQLLMKNIFSRYFPTAFVAIENDLMAVAKAFCGDEKGTIGILGTGANIAYYDGKKLYGEEFNLGYILGDEGSGAYLGKKLLIDFLHQKLPKNIHQKLLDTYPDLNRNFIIDAIYKQKNANRFLAKFAVFLNQNREDNYIFELIDNAFSTFLSIYLPLLPKESQKFPLHFVGGVAYHFQDILFKNIEKNNYITGEVAQNPIEKLKKYHYS